MRGVISDMDFPTLPDTNAVRKKRARSDFSVEFVVDQVEANAVANGSTKANDKKNYVNPPARKGS